jgi:hypothetical protein
MATNGDAVRAEGLGRRYGEGEAAIDATETTGGFEALEHIAQLEMVPILVRTWWGRLHGGEGIHGKSPKITLTPDAERVK